MSAYDTPSPAQGRRMNSNNNGGGGGGNTAFETPASRATSHHRSSEPVNSTNGFDSDASLSSVGALTRDLPSYASSPPIEAVVFAWGERAEQELRGGAWAPKIDSVFSFSSFCFFKIFQVPRPLPSLPSVLRVPPPPAPFPLNRPSSHGNGSFPPLSTTNQPAKKRRDTHTRGQRGRPARPRRRRRRPVAEGRRGAPRHAPARPRVQPLPARRRLALHARAGRGGEGAGLGLEREGHARARALEGLGGGGGGGGRRQAAAAAAAARGGDDDRRRVLVFVLRREEAPQDLRPVRLQDRAGRDRGVALPGAGLGGVRVGLGEFFFFFHFVSFGKHRKSQRSPNAFFFTLFLSLPPPLPP